MMKNKKILLFTVLFSLLCFFVGGCSSGSKKEEIPTPSSTNIYTQDFANVLNDDTKKKINDISTKIKEKSNAQVSVVTVKTLNQRPIEEYAHELFRKWGIGDKKLNNGVLILIATDDKKVRIEVGYGLEGAINDGKAGSIIREEMIPHFKANDFNSGVLSGYYAVVKEISTEYSFDEAAVLKSKTPTGSQSSGSKATEVGLLALLLALPFYQQLIIIFIVLFVMYLLLRSGIFINLFDLFGGGGSGDSWGGGDSGGGGSSGGWDD